MNLPFSDELLPRRGLLKRGAVAGAGLAFGGLLAGCGGSGDTSSGGVVPPPSGVTDADVLNFALNLEYLEAEYYLRGVLGNGLNASDGGDPAKVTGGRRVTFSTYGDWAEEIARDEEAHVRFLRAALGGSAVPIPRINFTDAFNAAAQAAGLGESFDPFANETAFLIGAFVFEDVGVTAYKGAARLLQNKDTLEAAAGILAVEAYHAGAVRAVLLAQGRTTEANAIAKLRGDASASVAPNTRADEGITVGGKANVVPTDQNSIAFSRNTNQVIKIVTLGGANNRGGFFPEGLNGRIQ